MLIKQLAAAVTSTGAQPAVNIDAGINSYAPQVNLCISITGGTARTVQPQASPDGVTWFNIGTSRTAIGDFFESVAAMPFFRVNVSANTGSTVNAWVVVPG